MDTWGIGIFVVGMLLYFLSKRKAIFLFVSGVGAGILIAALWVAMLLNQAFGSFSP
jgi:lipid-A-disaccharide synthase-like uncharacterized protein